MKNKFKINSDNASSGNISTSGSETLKMHKPNSNIGINKSDLQIYLNHYKDAITNKRKDGIFIGLSKIVFLWSIFFTSNFKDIASIAGSLIQKIYIVFAAIISICEIQKSLKKDNSKYGEVNPEKMADIIESNCKKCK